MKKKPVIAIDGYSSTGKSSISKEIARRLGLVQIDTGALYRGITLFALRCALDQSGKIDCSMLEKHLPDLELKFHLEHGELVLYLAKENITEPIRSQQVSENVSFIAKQSFVRDYHLEYQREMAKKGGVIMDGRDIGTTVLPEADYKFFLSASVQERSRRRHLELQSMGIDLPLEEVERNLTSRDAIDSSREASPLRQAPDAVLIDNTKLTKEETIEKILSFIS